MSWPDQKYTDWESKLGIYSVVPHPSLTFKAPTSVSDIMESSCFISKGISISQPPTPPLIHTKSRNATLYTIKIFPSRRNTQVTGPQERFVSPNLNIYS